MSDVDIKICKKNVVKFLTYKQYIIIIIFFIFKEENKYKDNI